MATATKSFTFAANSEGWVAVDVDADTVGSYNGTDQALQIRTFGRNKTSAQDESYWYWEGTWEALGVPSNSTVSAINATGTEYDWRVSEANVSDGGATGSFQLWTSGGGSLLGTMSTALSFGGTTTSWATRGSSAVSGLNSPSNTTIRLRLNCFLDNGNNANAATALQWDNVDLSIEYTVNTPSGTGAGALAVTGGDASGAKHQNLSGTAAAAIALAGTSTGALGAFDPPTGLTATPVSTSQINVSWNPVAGATGYDLQRERWNSSSWVDLTLIEDVTSTYPDTGLSPDTLYHYRVRAKK